MKDDRHADSVKLFFQSFARHLGSIRDEGKDAKQAYRAQILLGQLSLFEKAISDYRPSTQGGVPLEQTLLAFLELRDFDSLVTWISQQSLIDVSGLFYLNRKCQWENLYGDMALPPRIKLGEWFFRGIAGIADQFSDTHIAYLYGQPRLVLVYGSDTEPASELRRLFTLFVARMLPLFVHVPAKDRIPEHGPPSGMVARDGGFLELLSLIEQAAKKDVSILLEGESGTGKEVVAQFIHNHSGRSKKPMVAVNCAAIPAGLIESELFGHEKGAFTGAYNRQIGRVEEADGGTLFLDEIGEMELAMQAKLLRFLQLHEFHRIGGKRKISVNVRIIAATNKNIKQQVTEGKFREDLYYRLAVMPFKVPPLRERVDDIVPLAQYFLDKYSGEFGTDMPEVDASVYQILAGYDFPGNVRELENIIQNLLVVSQGGKILTHHLPDSMRTAEPRGALVQDEKGSVRTWRKLRNHRRAFHVLAQNSRPFYRVSGFDQNALAGPPPKSNNELKQRKQRIQDHASQLILELERHFLDNLLERAGGSMPKAAKLGNINRTLLYKMLDRTKHLE